MLDPYNLDFKELGFHAGLEVHHQLKSKRKLFCNCPPIIEKDPENMDYSFYRYFRPVLGEMGDFDPGMLVEFEKGYKVIYFANERNTCTYDMDETPPFFPDMEMMEKGFILAAYFDCSAFAEEIVVNRKQYLDGSITTGFQRTFICARDGWVPVNGKKVRITNVHIEEDAARRVNWEDTSNRTVYYNLDRLGVPLAEIITEYTDVDTPEELLETAKQIGRVLRISKIGRRGSGVARQDVNISIAGGDRVELKGVQDLEKIDVMCRHEVVRQHALIEIKKTMLQRGLKKEDFEHTYVDISQFFDTDETVLATIFTKMKGLFGTEVQPNKDFGLEIFEKSMLITGIPRKNQFHSDEIEDGALRLNSDYPSDISVNHDMYSKICSVLNPKENDAFIVVKGPEKRALHAMKKIVERVKMAIDGVPQETRRFLSNGNSEFLRVIHGKDRIYPDTDTPPIVISLDRIKELTKNVGKKPWMVFDEIHEKYGFDQQRVDLLIRDEKLEKFVEYTEQLQLDGNLSYKLLITLPREKRRKNILLTTEITDKLASVLSKKIIFKEQVELVLNYLIVNPKSTEEQLKEKFDLPELSDEKVEKMIQSQIDKYNLNKIQEFKEYQELILSKITGEILKKLNYHFEGKVLVEKIKQMISVKEDG
ncbi:MAG: Glu-tRNA(Gln) amidotransferase subunit GatE [Candidatus Heimdallarchaeota archaeon]|nr:Glu-tRNA(Gln) amidotransferase subunit GatE [Candidatus Heimdallarchaeota archaeon]